VESAQASRRMEKRSQKHQDWCSGGVQSSVRPSRWVVVEDFFQQLCIFHDIHQAFLPARLV
jgi:hypothetical protein